MGIGIVLYTIIIIQIIYTYNIPIVLSDMNKADQITTLVKYLPYYQSIIESAVGQNLSKVSSSFDIDQFTSEIFMLMY